MTVFLTQFFLSKEGISPRRMGEEGQWNLVYKEHSFIHSFIWLNNNDLGAGTTEVTVLLDLPSLGSHSNQSRGTAQPRGRGTTHVDTGSSERDGTRLHRHIRKACNLKKNGSIFMTKQTINCTLESCILRKHRGAETWRSNHPETILKPSEPRPLAKAWLPNPFRP